MNKIISLLMVCASISAHAAKYRVKLMKGNSLGGETASGYYFAELQRAANPDLSKIVKVYPGSKDAYYDLIKFSKDAVIEIEGSDESSPGSSYDKINAIIVYEIVRLPRNPRRTDHR